MHSSFSWRPLSRRAIGTALSAPAVLASPIARAQDRPTGRIEPVKASKPDRIGVSAYSRTWW